MARTVSGSGPGLQTARAQLIKNVSDRHFFGSFQGSSDKFGFHCDVQVFAGKGYAVLKPNHRGSTGDGDAFLRDMVAQVEMEWFERHVHGHP